MTGCGDSDDRARRALGLLCDDEPPRRGHLFLFTRRGLTFVASNTGGNPVPDVVAVAERCAEHEIDQAGATLVGGGDTRLDSMPAPATFRDASGVLHRAITLGLVSDGTYHVAGVAVVTDPGTASSFPAERLASTIARRLVVSGDVYLDIEPLEPITVADSPAAME
jgi:hypothetical protein